MANRTQPPPARTGRMTRKMPPGHDVRSIGPSDSSDSGSGFDRVVGPNEAGLGSGLDQAEEARLGITDEELEAQRRERARRPRT